MPKQNSALVDTTAGRSTTRRVARLAKSTSLAPGELAPPFMFARVSSPAAAWLPMSGRVVSPTARWLLLCRPSRGTPTTPARFCDSSGGGRAARRSHPRASRSVEPGQRESADCRSGVERRSPLDRRARSAPARRCKARSSCLIGVCRVDGAFAVSSKEPGLAKAGCRTRFRAGDAREIAHRPYLDVGAR